MDKRIRAVRGVFRLEGVCCKCREGFALSRAASFRHRQAPFRGW